MPWTRGILAPPATASGRRGRTPSARPADRRRDLRGNGRRPGCEPCSQSRPAMGSRTLARDLRALDVEVFATDGTREALAADGIEVRSVSELTKVPPLVGGQVKTFHPAVYAGILARRDVPAQLAGARRARHRPHRHRRRQRQAVRARASAPSSSGLDEAIEMIDVGGAALLGAAARNSAGVAAVAEPAALSPARHASSGSSVAVCPEFRPAAGRRGVRHGRRLLRRDRRLPQPGQGNVFPTPPRHGPREGRGPPLRGEPAPAGRLLPRDDPPQRDARRRDPGPGRRAVVQQPARPRRRLLASPATSRRPTVVIVKHTDPVGIGSHDDLVEAYRHALETDPVASFGGIVAVNRELDGATAREIAANTLRGGRRPGLQPGGARDPAPQAPASSSWPSRRTRPRACATTASPSSTSSASPAGCWSRRSTSSASTAASSRS